MSNSSSANFTPRNIAITAFALATVSFMEVLDITIANVSLPTISGNLGASANQATWVVTSFAVSNAVALPLTGFLSRRFGERRLLVGATLAFVFASLLCGLASNMGFLVFARVLQGAVAGPLYPVAQSLLISIFPANKRGQALALLAMITVVAPICGPILGGWITDNYSWEWIFFINIPIGLIAAWVIASQLRGRPERLGSPKMDYVGLITLVIGVGALQILLDLGNQENWFESTKIVILAIIAALGVTVFLIWELTERDPIVNLRLFRHRNFASGTLAIVIGYAAFSSIGLLMPLWLQRTMGYTPLWAGFATAPIGLLPVMLMPFLGKYAVRFDMRWLASFAFITLGMTSLLRARFNLDVDFQHVAWLQFWQGLGVALFFMPILTILLSDLEPHEIASGSGIAAFLRTLGGSFSASLTTWLWNDRTTVQHAHLTETLPVNNPTLQHTLTTLGEGDSQRGIMILNQMVSQQASQIGFNEIFYLLGVSFFVVILFVWLAKPPFAANLEKR